MCVTWPATKSARLGFIDLFDDVGSQEEGRVVDIRKISQKKRRRRSKMRVDIVELGCIQFAGGCIYCSPNSLICTHTHTHTHHTHNWVWSPVNTQILSLFFGVDLISSALFLY